MLNKCHHSGQHASKNSLSVTEKLPLEPRASSLIYLRNHQNKYVLYLVTQSVLSEVNLVRNDVYIVILNSVTQYAFIWCRPHNRPTVYVVVDQRSPTTGSRLGTGPHRAFEFFLLIICGFNDYRANVGWSIWRPVRGAKRLGTSGVDRKKL